MERTLDWVSKCNLVVSKCPLKVWSEATKTHQWVRIYTHTILPSVLLVLNPWTQAGLPSPIRCLHVELYFRYRCKIARAKMSRHAARVYTKLVKYAVNLYPWWLQAAAALSPGPVTLTRNWDAGLDTIRICYQSFWIQFSYEQTLAGEYCNKGI